MSNVNNQDFYYVDFTNIESISQPLSRTTALSGSGILPLRVCDDRQHQKFRRWLHSMRCCTSTE